MKRLAIALAALASALPALALAQDGETTKPPSAKEVLDAAPRSAWQEVRPEDLLIFELNPAPDGSERRIVLQLMREPWSQKWVRNIRKLAKARWWDTHSSVYRIAPGFVAQWGDPDEDRAPLQGLEPVGKDDFTHRLPAVAQLADPCADRKLDNSFCDPYAPAVSFEDGWPIGTDGVRDWPLHCPGMVGVARDVDPATGLGDTLYTIIGHAPRRLDRNLAVVGRVVEGLDLLRTQPPGTGEMGFYAAGQDPLEIQWARLASDLAPEARPRFKYLETESGTFAQWLAATGRPNEFYTTVPTDYDICALTYPVREIEGE